ncbi:NUDIX domain-containing protein [Streptomyces sp. MBT27]|uniref:NUDIX hydrolase n=1 Tax=Streptomyces sp. MBT27 TaxID=1488356 RepID=UPI001F071518|nr:NUDIX domain-containing protein [Streptomyces sp. MBT27]
MRSQPNIVGVHLVFEHAGQVLLQRRSPYSPFDPGSWHVPAGHLEEESATACAVQESEEELGVKIDPQDLRLVHVLHYRDSVAAIPRIQLFFRVLSYGGTPRICEPDRHTALAWHPYTALPSPLVAYTAVALTAIAVGRPFAAMGWAA